MKSLNKIDKYIFSLWSLTLAFNPILYGLYETYNGIRDKTMLFEFLVLLLIFSILFSLPALIITYFAGNFLEYHKVSFSIQKMIIIIISVVLMVITLTTIGGTLIPRLITYCFISTIIAVVILELISRINATKN